MPDPRTGGICIAIDGPASSGKGTVARIVARSLDYAYADSGAMYRVVALLADEQGVPFDAADRLAALAQRLRFDFQWDGDVLRVRVDGRDLTGQIRTETVGQGASAVSVHPPVRAALLERQRDLGRRGGVVMDGRDIGTVVLPDAELKVYLDAALAERARRRHLELEQRGIRRPLADVRREIEARDLQDSSRAVAPLKKADDAVLIDTTELTPDEAADRIVALARQRGA